MNSLRKKLDVTWKEKVPNVEIFRRTNCVSVENLLNRNRLRWVGHVIRMSDDRLPKQMLYGELSLGTRKTGGQLKRYKDVTKRSLIDCNIDPDNLESVASNRQEWRVVTKQGLTHFEEARTKHLEEARERRHRATTNPATTNDDNVCLECGRRCASRIGLVSHMRAHQRRRGAGRTVIVGHDGPP